MYLKGIEVGVISANCYLIGCEETKEAALIDPGGDAPQIMRLIENSGLTVKYIINTHGHIDHIGANQQVKEATGAELLIHEADAPMLTSAGRNLSLFTGRVVSGPAADWELKDGDRIKIGKTVELEVIHTPGHTPGGICLKTGDIIFTGDTLFAGSIGRTDFPGGSYRQLIESIKQKLMVFEDHVVVYPGHGPASTIGFERKHNPFL